MDKDKKVSVVEDIIFNSLNTFKADVRLVLEARFNKEKPGHLDITLVSAEKI